MKISFTILIGIATISLYFSYRTLNQGGKSLEEYRTSSKKLGLESENYLNSLVGKSQVSEDIITLLSGETLFLTETHKPCLVYFFSSTECMSCVEENIFKLIELIKNEKLSNVYIITTKKNYRYLELMSKVQNLKFLKFGYFPDDKLHFPSFYFMVFKNGDISNIYYPQKGDMEITAKYLHKCSIVLSTDDKI